MNACVLYAAALALLPVMAGCASLPDSSEPALFIEGPGWEPGYRWTYAGADLDHRVQFKKLYTDPALGHVFHRLDGDTDEWKSSHLQAIPEPTYGRRFLWLDGHLPCVDNCDEDVPIQGLASNTDHVLGGQFMRFPIESTGFSWSKWNRFDLGFEPLGIHQFTESASGIIGSVILREHGSFQGLEGVHVPGMGSVDAAKIRLQYSFESGSSGYSTADLHEDLQSYVQLDASAFGLIMHWSAEHRAFVKIETFGVDRPEFAHLFNSYFYRPGPMSQTYYLREFSLNEEPETSLGEILYSYGGGRGALPPATTNVTWPAPYWVELGVTALAGGPSAQVRINSYSGPVPRGTIELTAVDGLGVVVAGASVRTDEMHEAEPGRIFEQTLGFTWDVAVEWPASITIGARLLEVQDDRAVYVRAARGFEDTVELECPMVQMSATGPCTGFFSAAPGMNLSYAIDAALEPASDGNVEISDSMGELVWSGTDEAAASGWFVTNATFGYDGVWAVSWMASDAAVIESVNFSYSMMPEHRLPPLNPFQ